MQDKYKSIFSDRDTMDHQSFVKIAKIIDQCDFIMDYSVPNIVKEIAEYATGKVIQCPHCAKDIHLLPSELQYITYICQLYNLQQVLCRCCFNKALQDRQSIKYNDWLENNCHFGFIYESMIMYPY